ncbi:hypothetical protein EDM00_05555 [Ornithobacterium rhinotracheale]|uniref:lipocalin family protein n=1 Tax=Ornithobacterium rhinotracheale TaxID=28251 RepID=UPI00129CF5D6|nr:lipocalin family protein [Ornithobacterium rhinotracheale]MRI63455.1 hypothetical protein [Ornithobacterium rhinotracheale]
MNFKVIKYPLIAGAAAFLLFNLVGCVSIPKGVQAVKGFEKEKYLGKWYEIARFDFKFEKNMKNVTAEYSQNADGSIKVVNRGFNTKKNKWDEAVGKAKFVNEPTEARLKVSFFGPFYAGYNVVMMEPDYENVLVMGNNTDYIWFLSRNKKMPEDVKQKFMQKAKDAGYDLSRLVWTEQD